MRREMVLENLDEGLTEVVAECRLARMTRFRKTAPSEVKASDRGEVRLRESGRSESSYSVETECFEVRHTGEEDSSCSAGIALLVGDLGV